MTVLRRGSLLALWSSSSRSRWPRRRARRQAATRSVPRSTRGGQGLGGRTQATISSHGLAVGHTAAAFTINQAVRTTASFTGPIDFTNALGTLTAQVAGTFDVASGAFRATSTSLTGTGLLWGISGSVTLEGLEDFATLRFTETITGRLCLD